MKRFLVLEKIFNLRQKTIHDMEEPVQDFDSLSEALDWIDLQEHPENYRAEDQFEEELAEDNPELDALDNQHDFRHYETRDFGDEYDEDYDTRHNQGDDHE